MQPLDALGEIGSGLSAVTERWVPDSWVICMILTTLSLALAVFGARVGVEEAVLAWGGGMWTLLELAMQFTIAMVAAHACVTSRPVFRLLDHIASLPDPERPVQAVVVAGVFSLVTGSLNWALCLVACALFVPFLCRRNPRADVRRVRGRTPRSGDRDALCALQSRVPPRGGTVALSVVVALHPRRDVVTFDPEHLDAILPAPPPDPQPPTTPGGRIESFRSWVLLAAFLIAYPLGHSIVTRGFGTSWTINAYNAVFLAAALLLQGHPVPFLRACRRGVDAPGGSSSSSRSTLASSVS